MTLKEMANHFEEVQEWTWDMESYIKFVLSPLEKAIKEEMSDDPRKDVLLALLSCENEKLLEMMDCIQRDLGKMKIKTRGADRGCLLGEKVVNVSIESTDNQPSMSEKKVPQRHLFLERRHYNREG